MAVPGIIYQLVVQQNAVGATLMENGIISYIQKMEQCNRIVGNI